MDNQNKKNKLFTMMLIAAFMLVSGLGAFIFTTQPAQAEDSTPPAPPAGQPFAPARFGGRGGFGFGEGPQGDQFFADALGITIEELQAAREKAAEAALEQAVTNGDITIEQASLIKARQALMKYLNMDEMLAQVLGVSTDELKAMRQAGQSLQTLIEEKGLTVAEVEQALQSAYQQAVQTAVGDGIITQEQADQILSIDFEMRLPGLRGGHGPGQHGGQPPENCCPCNSNSEATQ